MAPTLVAGLASCLLFLGSAKGMAMPAFNGTAHVPANATWDRPETMCHGLPAFKNVDGTFRECYPNTNNTAYICPSSHQCQYFKPPTTPQPGYCCSTPPSVHPIAVPAPPAHLPGLDPSIRCNGQPAFKLGFVDGVFLKCWPKASSNETKYHCPLNYDCVAEPANMGYCCPPATALPLSTTFSPFSAGSGAPVTGVPPTKLDPHSICFGQPALLQNGSASVYQQCWRGSKMPGWSCPANYDCVDKPNVPGYCCPVAILAARALADVCPETMKPLILLQKVRTCSPIERCPAGFGCVLGRSGIQHVCCATSQAGLETASASPLPAVSFTTPAPLVLCPSGIAPYYSFVPLLGRSIPMKCNGTAASCPAGFQCSSTNIPGEQYCCVGNFTMTVGNTTVKVAGEIVGWNANRNHTSFPETSSAPTVLATTPSCPDGTGGHYRYDSGLDKYVPTRCNSTAQCPAKYHCRPNGKCCLGGPTMETASASPIPTATVVNPIFAGEDDFQEACPRGSPLILYDDFFKKNAPKTCDPVGSGVRCPAGYACLPTGITYWCCSDVGILAGYLNKTQLFQATSPAPLVMCPSGIAPHYSHIPELGRSIPTKCTPSASVCVSQFHCSTTNIPGEHYCCPGNGPNTYPTKMPSFVPSAVTGAPPMAYTSSFSPPVQSATLASPTVMCPSGILPQFGYVPQLGRSVPTRCNMSAPACSNQFHCSATNIPGEHYCCPGNGPHTYPTKMPSFVPSAVTGAPPMAYTTSFSPPVQTVTAVIPTAGNCPNGTVVFMALAASTNRIQPMTCSPMAPACPPGYSCTYGGKQYQCCSLKPVPIAPSFTSTGAPFGSHLGSTGSPFGFNGTNVGWMGKK